MKSTWIKRNLFFCSLMLISGITLEAEPIQGNTVGFISNSTDTQKFYLENIVFLNFQDDQISERQEGLEIKIDIPPELDRFQNNFALLLFKTISPSPSMSGKKYSGTRAYMRLISAKGSMYVRIPFKEKHNITGDALTNILPVPINLSEFPVAATIVPVMKGIPDFAFQKGFAISAKPIFKNEGTVRVNIKNLSENPDEVVTVIIDGKEVSPNSPIKLESGLHKIYISSTHAPVVERNVVMEPGQAIDVDIEFDYRKPGITLKAPSGTTILLDGQKIDYKGDMMMIEVDPGEHEITGILGDSEIRKTFSVRPGGRVSIEILLDVKILEDESGIPFGAGTEN